MVTVSEPPRMEMDRNCDLAELVRNHQAGVWRYLRYLGAKASEAEDLTQETFLAVTGADSQTNFEQRSPVQTAAYLRTVARNRLLMARRSQSREIHTVELAAAETVWAKSTKDGRLDDYLVALADCLENSLKNSDGRARQAIDKFYGNQQGRTEIAKELKMTPEGVKTLLRRTRDLLRKCIERHIGRAATEP
jgi:RNA polymerase sigma-70 factor (ECF subfamily)